jgi:hypothetical protein
MKKDGSLIRFAQETLQTQKNTLHIIHSTPLILQNVKADPARKVHIGVIDWGFKEDSGRCIRVIRRKGKGEFEHKVFIGCLGRSNNGCCPRQQIAVCVWKGRYPR